MERWDSKVTVVAAILLGGIVLGFAAVANAGEGFAELFLSAVAVLFAFLGWLHLRNKPSPVVPIQWMPIDQYTDTRDLLDWKSRLSQSLVGREDEEKDLLDWARNGGGVKVRFLSGPGGVGKTRLAAEVAKQLADEGWIAGVSRDDAHQLLAKANHTRLFLVVDYPEDSRERTEELLKALANNVPEGAGPVRALLVSRYSQDDWEEKFSVIDTRLGAGRKDRRPLTLLELDTPQAIKLFTNAFARCGDARGLSAVEVPETDLKAWLDSGPDRQLFHLPLFVTAAAVHCVFELESHGGEWGGLRVGLTAREVMSALVKRETKRMDSFGKERDSSHLNPLVKRLMALATVRGGLDEEALESLAKSPPDELVFPKGEGVVSWARGLDWWNRKDHQFDPLRPDVLGAALVFEVFREWERKAPEWLWMVLSTVANEKRSEWLAAADRIDYDIRRVYGDTEDRFAGWLTEMVAGRLERARALEYVTSENGGDGTLRLTACVGEELLQDLNLNVEKRAKLVNNHSVHLANLGSVEEAWMASVEAVAIYHVLAARTPELFELALASSLMNRSRLLSRLGRSPEQSIGGAEWAVDIFRRYGDRTPELAACLAVYARCLYEQGMVDDALAAIEESLVIYEPLLEQDLEGYAPGLAVSLANSSAALAELGYEGHALAVIKKALAVCQRLVQAVPGRHEGKLAAILSSYSIRLGAKGDDKRALDEMEKSVKIRRQMAERMPRRYAPDLATGLTNYSDRLSKQGHAVRALSVIGEAVEIRRGLVEEAPDRYEPYLALSLNTWGHRLEEMEEYRDALDRCEEALRLLQKHRNRLPGFVERHLPDVEGDLERLRGLLKDG